MGLYKDLLQCLIWHIFDHYVNNRILKNLQLILHLFRLYTELISALVANENLSLGHVMCPTYTIIEVKIR